jgi:hypothetical protein
VACFPPRWTVSRSPAWNWPDIDKWATETKRLRDTNRDEWKDTMKNKTTTDSALIGDSSESWNCSLTNHSHTTWI